MRFLQPISFLFLLPILCYWITTASAAPLGVSSQVLPADHHAARILPRDLLIAPSSSSTDMPNASLAKSSQKASSTSSYSHSPSLMKRRRRCLGGWCYKRSLDSFKEYLAAALNRRCERPKRWCYTRKRLSSKHGDYSHGKTTSQRF